MNLFEVYSPYDIEPVKGHGCYVYDRDGTRYLDLYGGHAVVSVGHSHPHYVEAVQQQVASLGFYSNAVHNPLQQQLADHVGRLSGCNDYSLFLCNSGAEANENAMKLASFHTGRAKILAFSKAFHGRTSGAVAATDNPRIVSPFNVTPHVEFVPLNDIGAVEAKLATGEFAGVIIEGIQGVAGIHVPDDDFMRELREVTSRYGAVLILDEVQSGYYRSGRFYAHQYTGIKPDLITMAKGIANGFPMGAVAISPMFKAWKGMLGTTFGGNHLACAAAIAVAEIMEWEELGGNAIRVGDRLRSELASIPGVKEVRGRGLMIGFDVEDAATLRRRLLFEHHIFTDAAGVSTIRLLPPLCLGMDQALDFIDVLKQIMV